MRAEEEEGRRWEGNPDRERRQRNEGGYRGEEKHQ
jgi:hypothetical protein